MLEAKVDITKDLKEKIDGALKEAMEVEFNEAIKRFNLRKNEIISRILLSVQREIDINTHGQTVTFTIKEIK